MRRGRVVLRGVFTLALALAALVAADAAGQEAGSPVRDAARHFERGVTLHGEANYAAALVEFKRAYALSPNAEVLYNIGEMEYQLQDYAAALGAFERFLADSNPTDGHRDEVERDVSVLHARVGHLSLKTDPPGAEVSIDDRSVGKTPIYGPLLVSVGHRKVSASMAGRLPVTRYVDIAADDSILAELQLPALVDASPPPPRPLTIAPSEAALPSQGGSALRAVAWVATGLLAAGAVTFGLLAAKESRDLVAARGAFPTTSDTLARDAYLTMTYSIIADSLTGAALIVGGCALASTISSSAVRPPPRRVGKVRLVLGPASARIQGTF